MMKRKRLTPREYIVFLLGRREYSELEVRQRLKQRGCEEAEIEDAVSFSKELGIQSDTRYATIKARSEGRRKGNRSIRRTLSQQGIETEQIDQELNELAPETERVLGAIKRFEGKPLDLKLKAKIWRFLMSRGFSRDAIESAFAHLKADPEAA